MHDINGKPLHIGSEIYSVALGLLLIKSVKEEHSPEGGALIECVGVARGGGSVDIRTHEHKVTLVHTWKELAIEALAVQDASNLSGVVISFGNVIREVRTRLEAEGKGGSDNVHAHPICALYSDKIASLTGTQSLGNDKVSLAYRWAYDMKGGV